MEPKKKMSLMQLTFIVAVNMMGSGIIMLPSNMARVGAISLLSWVVTAVGSMAIAYGFAQAGLFNQRPGGMAAYAEDAYKKPGYFQVFFLYFLSLAIGNVAIAISAVGYLASFVPWLSSTPVATTLGVIGLLWLTTFANFGGPGVTGKIGSVTVWGVLIPVGMLCLIGWFWFKGDTFAAAWNPKGMSLLQGMGSSIALTLWAFLGMESAAQNSAAVENPKRDVPLACMFGTLGAAAIYVLSTTVIQGIVPNAELASSTGPFGLAYAKMFNPTIGSIIMGLAVLACLGSLLGWQFTLAQTAKSAADDRMFPRLFSKENRMGAPIAGMIVMGVVQSGMALSTMSPSLSEQFGALVNLAVVTNVVPYIISLSALPLMMRVAGVEKSKYQRNVVITFVALAYSIYALYASGKDAVFGGMIVMGIAYVIWGSIAHRFVPQAGTAGKDAGLPVSKAAAAVLLVIGALALAVPAAGATLDQAKERGTIRLGYRPDAAPLSFRDAAGKPAGYSVAVCQKIADGREGRARSSRPRGGVGAGHRRRPVRQSRGGRDRRVVRRDVGDARPPRPGLVLHPHLPRRDRGGDPLRRPGPVARGAGGARAAVPPGVAGLAQPGAAGEELRRGPRHHGRGLAREEESGAPGDRRDRRRRKLRRGSPPGARAPVRRRLRRSHPAAERDREERGRP